jgi:hypothetical protein
LAGRLLRNPAEAKHLGAAAQAAADELGGAVEKTVAAVEQLRSQHARA